MQLQKLAETSINDMDLHTRTSPEQNDVHDDKEDILNDIDVKTNDTDLYTSTSSEQNDGHNDKEDILNDIDVKINDIGADCANLEASSNDLILDAVQANVSARNDATELGADTKSD